MLAITSLMSDESAIWFTVTSGISSWKILVSGSTRAIAVCTQMTCFIILCFSD